MLVTIISNVKMLYYNRIDISERIDVMTELTFLKELMLIRGVNQKKDCHYWYFQNEEFKFQPNVCSGCHDVYEPSWYCYFKHQRCCIIAVLLAALANVRQKLNAKAWPDQEKAEHYKTKFLLSYVNTGKKNLTFDDIEILKKYVLPPQMSCCFSLFLFKVDIEQVLVSKKISSAEKIL